MKEQHTKGPWTYDETYGLIMAGSTEIAACHSGVKANAQLIAAAPEMLKTIENLTAELTKSVGQPTIISDDLIKELTQLIEKVKTVHV